MGFTINRFKINLRVIALEFHNIFLGGVHAGAITVIWAMEELARNPRTMKKAQDEIRKSVGKKGRLAEESIDELQYLEMVIKETLRWQPSCSTTSPKRNHVSL